MYKIKTILFFIILSFSMLATAGKGVPSNVASLKNLIFDSELSDTEKTNLDSDFNKMNSMTINGDQIRRYSEIFGGDGSENVVIFVDDRLNYVLSASTDIQDRIIFSKKNYYPLIEINAEVIASNQGTAIWLFKMANNSEPVQIEINDTPVDITSTRIGIVQLGNIFVNIPSLYQIATLVHEARHSDCTGGIFASDIQRLQNGLLPLNHHCGHLHATCPLGHELEGIFACDDHPWGAYAIEGIYSAAVTLECSNCSESDRAVAEIVALDSFSRLLYDLNDLLNGVYGDPDMSSSNETRPEL